MTSRYAFDLATKFGGIHSDFAGSSHREHLTADKFSEGAPAPAAHIHLRVGIGGIEIQKLTPDALIPAT